jgi:putative DNA primase/helicase
VTTTATPTKPKPKVLDVDPALIPARMKAERRWVCWRWEWKPEDEEWAKVPINARTGGRAMSNNQATWSTFSAALDRYLRSRESGADALDGIGFMTGDGWCGVDADDCLGADGELTPMAAEIYARLGTYTEVSPRGGGLKAFGFGVDRLPRDKGAKDSKLKLEVYCSVRFLAITGRRFCGTDAVDIKDAIAWVYDAWLPHKKDQPPKPPPPPTKPIDLSDEELVGKIVRKPKFAALWNGDTTGYGSPSEADLALCNRVTFFVGNDPGRIDRVFRLSSLGQRGKWLEREDYRNWTINKALEGRTAFYTRPAPRPYMSGMSNGQARRTPAEADPAGAPPEREPGIDDEDEEDDDDDQQPPDDLDGPDVGEPQAGPPDDGDNTPPLARLTDVGNGLRFVNAFEGVVRYVPEWGWMVWDGRRWERDALGKAQELVKQAARDLHAGATAEMNEVSWRVGITTAESATQDENELKRLKERHGLAMKAAAWAIKSEDARRVGACLSMAKTDPRIAISFNKFDTDVFALNVANGTIDLRTGKLRPHRQADYITKFVNVRYDQNADAPTWGRFLAGTFARDFDLINWTQRWAGWCCSGDTREEIIAILYGSGGNGKSTFVRTLLELLGEYAHKANAEMFLAQKSDRHPTERASLCGKRFVAATETGESRRLNESLIKDMTGGEPITAHFMRRDEFTFDVQFKVAMSTNHKPRIYGTDKGIWRRVRLVPFTQRFWKDGEPPGAPDMRADPTMVAKLRDEFPGILAWMVRGAMEFFSAGLGRCKAIDQATQEYREAEDTVGQFLDERTVKDPKAETGATELYRSYHSWAEHRGEKPMSGTLFGTKITDGGLEKRKTGGKNVYVGIRISQSS